MRYLHDHELPPVAAEAQRERLRVCCLAGAVQLSGRANVYLNEVWHQSPKTFVKAVLQHLEDGFRVFQKYERGSNRLLASKLQASVLIREPNEQDRWDDGTVYVEFDMHRAGIVRIADAHEHEKGVPRLPR